jgi:hypothetical protein
MTPHDDDELKMYGEHQREEPERLPGWLVVFLAGVVIIVLVAAIVGFSHLGGLN